MKFSINVKTSVKINNAYFELHFYDFVKQFVDLSTLPMYPFTTPTPHIVTEGAKDRISKILISFYLFP